MVGDARMARHASMLLLRRRVTDAFAAWRLELWHKELIGTVSRLQPRRPVASPLKTLTVMPLSEQPPEWHGGPCRPEVEPRRPPISRYALRRKKSGKDMVRAVQMRPRPFR